MTGGVLPTNRDTGRNNVRNGSWKRWRKGLPLYLMILPGLLYFLIFRYLPMGGLVIAFQEYDPFNGFLHSPWVGLEQFHKLFGDPDFWLLLKNTLLLSALNLFLFFPAPIVLALLLNEVRVAWFRKTMQTIVYMPHFMSWVVIVSISVLLFAGQDGGITILLKTAGFHPLDILTDPGAFRFVYLFQNIWKESGWNAVIFLAALAAVDPTQYEAAVIDGANRWKMMWHITLPAVRSTVIIMFILRLGTILDTGFEHIFLLQNSLNLSASDVFDTYVYRIGIQQAQFSYTTAVSLFKSVIALVLIVTANKLSKKIGEEGVY